MLFEQILEFFETVLATTITFVQWLIQEFWKTLGYILSGNFSEETIGAILVFAGAILFLFLLVMMILPQKKLLVLQEQNILAGFSLYQRPEPPRQVLDLYEIAQDNSDPTLRDLRRIERDMLALKELFDADLIKANLYILESKSLYKSAKDIFSD